MNNLLCGLPSTFQNKEHHWLLKQQRTTGHDFMVSGSKKARVSVTER